MMSKKKKIIVGTIGGVLLGGGLLIDESVLADTCTTEKECQEVIDNMKDEISQIEQETGEKESHLAEVENDIQGLLVRIEQTEAKIKKANADIEVKEKEIKDSQEELKALNTEITELKEVVADRMRLSRRMSRSNMILNFLSEADSLIELIRSIQNINHFAEQDSKRMDELRTKVREQNELMSRLKAQKESLAKTKEELEANQRQLEKDQVALEKKREETKKEIQALESEKMSVEEAKAIAEEQKALLERLAEEERKRQEEEERKKQEALQQQQQQQQQQESNNGSSSSGGPSSSGPSSIIPVSSTFVIPLQTGYVTCEFGCYVDSKGIAHNGIDLGNRGNTSTPVLASASGIVTRSGWHHAYGNHLMITHNINGQIYTTVYAHLHTTPYVSVGTVVSQGQQVGTMGNTGNSFGAHLHFELYEGYYNYPYSVNPRKYINFPSHW